MSGYTPSQINAIIAAAHRSSNEVWIEFAVGVLIIFARLGIQTYSLGIRKLHWDDWIMATVIATYTLSTIGVQQVFRWGGTNSHMSDAQRAALTPEMITARENGTKWFFTAEVFYACVVYSTKSCMTFFLGRLTTGLSIRKWVTFTHHMITFGFILNVVFLLAGCSPFMKRFQVIPEPPKMCQVDSAFYEINTNPLNIVIDMFLIVIPLPMLYKSSLDIKRKIFIGILLTSAIFTVVALVLRVVISLFLEQSATTASTSASWAAREWVISIAVANAPIIGPIFTYQYWHPDARARRNTGAKSCPSNQNLSDKANNNTNNTQRSFCTVKSLSDSTDHIVEQGRSIDDIEMGIGRDREQGVAMQSLQIEHHKSFEVVSQRAVDVDAEHDGYRSRP